MFQSKITLSLGLISLCAMMSFGNIASNTFAVEPQFNSHFAVDVDSSGYVLVADTSNAHIQKFSNTGTSIANSGAFGTMSVT